MKSRFLATVTFALLVAIQPCSAQETIGAPLIARSGTDGSAGSIFTLNSGFTLPGTLASWAFFNDNSGQTGMALTPLLLEITGGNYIITGVGTPRANSATGIQNFAFGLTSGSDLVGPGTLFGWKDGTDANPSQTGVIPVDVVGTTAAGTQQWFGEGHSGDLFPGSNLGSGILLGAGVGQPDRDYSVQATTAPAEVPEPGSVSLLAGALTLGGLALRRRKR